MAFNHVTYTGPHTLDLAPLEGKLVDIEDGGMQGLRQDMAGFPSVVSTLAEAVPNHGAAAGIPQDVYDHFVMCNGTVQKIEEMLAVAQKQVEVLQESRAYYIDARQNDIGMMVDSMRSRAQRRKDAAILVPFEAVLKYNGQIGDKAVRTRRKNKAAKLGLEAPEMEETPQAPAVPAAPPATPSVIPA